MGKIDTITWREYRIGDFFDAYLSKDDLQPKNIQEGNTPLISSGKENNGVVAYITSEKATIWEANTLTVDMFGKVFYQPEPYYCVSHGRVNILKPKIEMEENVMRFIGVAIESVTTKKYEFVEMCTGTKLLEDKIMLPVKDDKLDITAINNIINENKEKAAEIADELLAIENKHDEKIDISRWAEFDIKELFDVVKGSRLTKADMIDGNINYVGASSFNNGITCRIGNDTNIHPAGTMTVTYNGSDIGRTFYQEEEYWATDDVNVLYPKFELTKEIALFLAPIIKAVGCNHVYKDKWQIEDMKLSKIPLPIKKDNTPDWDYMTAYVLKLQDKVDNFIELI